MEDKTMNELFEEMLYDLVKSNYTFEGGDIKGLVKVNTVGKIKNEHPGNYFETTMSKEDMIKNTSHWIVRTWLREKFDEINVDRKRYQRDHEVFLNRLSLWEAGIELDGGELPIIPPRCEYPQSFGVLTRERERKTWLKRIFS